MPHDLKGKVVEIGQEVSIPAVVTSVTQGDEYCNCTVETIHAMYPAGGKSSVVLNTKQVEVTKDAPWRAQEVPDASA